MAGRVSGRTNENDSILFDVLENQILYLNDGIFVHSR